MLEKEEALELPEGNPFAEEAEVVEDDGEAEVVETAEVEEDPAKAHVQKTVALGTFQKRVSKLVSQRNRERDRADAATEKAARLEGALSQSKIISDAVTNTYKGNMTQLAWDAKFLSEFETQAAVNPEVARVAAAVQAAMKVSRPVAENTKVSESNENQAMMDKVALRAVKTELIGLGVAPEFAQKIAKDSVAEYETQDLLDLDRSAAVTITKGWLAENGFKSDQIMAKAVADAGEKTGEKPKLNVSGGGGNPTNGPKNTMKAPLGAKVAARQPLAARAAFEDRHAAAFRDFAEDFNKQD
jgi:myosin heavy subunit